MVRQRGTVLESSYGNMSAHKKFQPKAQNKELGVDCYMHPPMKGMHNWHKISMECDRSNRKSEKSPLKYSFISIELGSSYTVGSSYDIIE